MLLGPKLWCGWLWGVVRDTCHGITVALYFGHVGFLEGDVENAQERQVR